MPADKRKKSKTPEEVPEPGNPERKRVLNVLAQRRYRQRRREKIAALEAQAKQSSDQQHDGGAWLEPQNTASAASETMSEESPEGIEEVIRDAEYVGFASLDFNQVPLDMQLFQDFSQSDHPDALQEDVYVGGIEMRRLPSAGFSNLPSPIPSTPTSTEPSLNFPITPDGGQLSIPILPVMRAFATIATALDLVSHIYDPSYLHTLPPAPPPSLPSNLHPTPSQITIPHHPFIDTLPWPSVREKLICMFSLPSALRPPIAQDDEGDEGQSKAVVRLAQDLDDCNEGVRIHGNMVGWHASNELVEEAWEIGEVFFRNWWWCLDGKIVETTNRRRRERGLGALRIKG